MADVIALRPATRRKATAARTPPCHASEQPRKMNITMLPPGKAIGPVSPPLASAIDKSRGCLGEV
eukprot:scaffold2036_cov115-Isochrysis_galbana.AAC.15